MQACKAAEQSQPEAESTAGRRQAVVSHARATAGKFMHLGPKVSKSWSIHAHHMRSDHTVAMQHHRRHQTVGQRSTQVSLQWHNSSHSRMRSARARVSPVYSTKAQASAVSETRPNTPHAYTRCHFAAVCHPHPQCHRTSMTKQEVNWLRILHTRTATRCMQCVTARS